MKHRLIIAGILLVLALSGCGGLAGEPQIVSTSALPTVPPTAPPDLGRPTARVSLARGAEIFGGPQGCQNCHGITGKGDGVAASSFACPLPNFTDAEMARSQTITAWFAITSSGNQGSTSCLMPPWKGRLNEQQRWDVTSYVYSLHYTSDLLVQGKNAWQANCAACHGDTGKGDGPQTKQLARPVPNFNDSSTLIAVSDTELWKIVTDGLGAAMPAFKDKLDDTARWAVVAYARSLGWDSALPTTPVPTAAATQAATAAPDTPTVLVRGKVANSTPGSSVPAGQNLTLRIIDLANNAPKDVETLQAKVGADGTFSFGEVTRHLNMVYVVTTEYGGILQTSTPVRLVPGAGPVLDLSFLIYDVTNDAAALVIEIEHIFISPFSANTLLVRQGISFRNDGNRLFTNGRNSVEVTLPAGAQQIVLDPNTEQQFTIDGNHIRGLVPIYPGESNAQPLQFSYLLPFDVGAEFAMPTVYRIAKLSIHTPQASSLVPANAPFVAGDTVQLQDGIYVTYTFQGHIAAGNVVRFALQGQQDQSAARRNVLAVVLFAVGLLVLITGGVVWWLNRKKAAGSATAINPADSLIQEIANLDDQFEKGKIRRDEYERERARLKEEAAKLLE